MKFHPCPDTKPHGRHEWYRDNITREDCAGICAHCLGPLRGHGSVQGRPLCHPSDGMDCYHLVTLYGHELPEAGFECSECVKQHVVARLAAPRDQIDDEEFADWDAVLRAAREES